MAKRLRIYKSAKYLAGTFLIILLPILFFLVFSGKTEVARGELFREIYISFLRMLLAYLISVTFAWIFAVSFYKGKAASVMLPIFDVLQSFPTFAALPLAIYLWGTSNITIVSFLVITIIWPIFFSAVSSLKLIRPDWENVVQISNLTGTQFFKKFLIPVTVPGVITGSIIGLGEGWEALIATEIIVGAGDGLGSFFNKFSTNTPVTIFGIFGFLLLIFALNKIVWLPLLDESHRKMEE